MAMTKSYQEEALQTYAILYANGNPGMCRPDYPPPVWESIIRHAHLAHDIEVRYVMNGTPEAEKLEMERQKILAANAEREDIVEAIDVPAQGDRIATLEAQIAMLTKMLGGQMGVVVPYSDTPPTKEPQVAARGTYTKESLTAMDINDLRPLAVAYKTSGAGTREALVARILEQIGKGVLPE